MIDFLASAALFYPSQTARHVAVPHLSGAITIDAAQVSGVALLG
jgi:hypothetical protein